MQILNGNQILVQSIINLGGTFFSGYPITPASSIMHEWVKQSAKNKKLKFIQSEDELSAINMAIGASLAGRISFTATSGPGLSLMQESIGWAFAIECPLVIIDSMRRGPSTGMPTIGAQGDILQTNFGSQGDYKVPVFYPTTLEDIPKWTYEAFKTAENLKTPVILLLDGYLSKIQENIDEKVYLSVPIVKKGIKSLGNSKKSRYWTGLVTDEEGNVKSYFFGDYEKWINKRLTKVNKLRTNKFYNYINNQNKKLIISFGITTSLCNKVLSQGYDLLIIHQLFPVQADVLNIIEKYERVFVCEINKGQYSFVLRSYIPDNEKIKHIEIEDIEIAKNKILEKLHAE